MQRTTGDARTVNPEQPWKSLQAEELDRTSLAEAEEHLRAAEEKHRVGLATLADALGCVDRAANADHDAIRCAAVERFSLEAVAPKFVDWFDRLDTLMLEGWYTLPERVAR